MCLVPSVAVKLWREERRIRLGARVRVARGRMRDRVGEGVKELDHKGTRIVKWVDNTGKRREERKKGREGENDKHTDR